MKFFRGNKKDKINKVIVTDFKNLNPGDFKPFYNLTKEEIKKEFALLSPDGKVYINSLEECSEFFADVFNILTKEDYYALEAYRADCTERYPGIKSIGDLDGMQGSDEEKKQVLAMFIIPMEFKRREIEKRYYGS